MNASTTNEWLENLITNWEKRAKTADKNANDAAGAGDWMANLKGRTKAEAIRSMIDELKFVISCANSQDRSSRSDLF